MNTLSAAVNGYLITLSSLNPEVPFEIRWSSFVDGFAQVEVSIGGRILSGSSKDIDPDKARIKAVNCALQGLHFQIPEPPP